MAQLNPTQKPHIISVDNDRIIVEYYGEAPDMGAFEYSPILGDVNNDQEISIIDISYNKLAKISGLITLLTIM